MFSRERYLSEEIAELAWRIPGLDFSRKADLQDWITRKERQRLGNLQKEVLQKLQALASGQDAEVAPGFRGPMADL